MVSEALLLPISRARKRSEARKREQHRRGGGGTNTGKEASDQNRSDSRPPYLSGERQSWERGIVDAPLRRQSWERGFVVAMWDRGRAVAEAVVGTWVRGCKRITT